MSTLLVTECGNPLDPNNRSFEERARELKAIDKIDESVAKHAKSSPFSRWTQYNLEHTQKMMWLQLKHPKAAAILSFLVDQMDEYNAVMCSYKVLEEILGVSKDRIRINIKILKENGYIAVLKSGSSNVYAINDTIFWKSWGNNRQHSKFPANVILSLSEQEELIEKQKNIGFTRHKEVSIKEVSTDGRER
jgi:DNA-binding transcriptional ArsR family regulator